MRQSPLLVALAAAILIAGAYPASALEIEAADTLPDRVVDPEPNGRVLDTALVFTNVSGEPQEAKFEAYDGDGSPISSGRIGIPAHGLVYVLASRMADAAGIDGFVGSVKAKATGHVRGSTVILGGVLTDVDTVNNVRRVRRDSDAAVDTTSTSGVITRIIFPVVATR